jgi:hypothetical protein
MERPFGHFLDQAIAASPIRSNPEYAAATDNQCDEYWIVKESSAE